MSKKVKAEKSIISKPWQNFLTKLDEIDSVPENEWEATQLLGYILKKFEITYHRKFILSMKNAPSKCPELFLIKKMQVMLGDPNIKTCKECIDWIYKKKIVDKNAGIRSLGLFTTPGILNEFMSYWAKENKITRTTELPSHYLEIAKTLNIAVRTFGDLAFIKLSLANNSNTTYQDFYQTIKTLGFDENILNGLV